MGRTASTENATLCGDRACRVREMQARVRFVPCPRNPLRMREMQARVRFVPCPRNPLRKSRVSSARNAGESAICPMCAQPSAGIVRVECAKCRSECDLSGVRATLCGDRACRVCEMQARARLTLDAGNPLRRSCLCGTTLVRGVSGELEDENWRLCSDCGTTLVYTWSIWGAGR